MNKMPQISISSQLANQSKARALSQLRMGRTCAVTLWTNQDDYVAYENTEGHVFSLYVRGGDDVARVDKQGMRGRTGALSIMPQGHSSIWDVNKPFEFLHVYLSDEEMRRQYSETFDKDARLLEVREQTFIDGGFLVPIFQELQTALHAESPISAEEALSALIIESVKSDVLSQDRLPKISGGLSPKILKRVKDFALAHLDENISLKDLASLAGLSDYHFQRNFKAQCGVSPHIWLTWQRIELAKRLIMAHEPMVQIAQACGFSSQSHFSRTFKQYTGQTPAAFGR